MAIPLPLEELLNLCFAALNRGEKKFNSRLVAPTFFRNEPFGEYVGGLFRLTQWLALDLQRGRSGPNSRPSSARPRAVTALQSSNPIATFAAMSQAIFRDRRATDE
jgi:hypothetical protein